MLCPPCCAGADQSVQVTGEVSTEGVMKMTRKTWRDLAQMLGKSIPHALTGALSASLTHSPISDYYYYYCYKDKEYCQYADSAVAPSSMYYSFYYAGHSAAPSCDGLLLIVCDRVCPQAGTALGSRNITPISGSCTSK